MKKSNFTDEQIIGILNGLKGSGPDLSPQNSLTQQPLIVLPRHSRRIV